MMNLAAARAQVFSKAQQWDEIVEKGYVIIGTPDEVADQLRNVVTTLNVGHLMLLLQFGNMSRDVTQYNTRLFAEQVAPQIGDLFDDEWEDHWWPQPMQSQVRATPQPVAQVAAPLAQ